MQQPKEVEAMAGLPRIDERAMRATYGGVLAARPDDLAQTDAARIVLRRGTAQ